MNDNERWLLSFYRSSEIAGALFFGRLARVVPPGQVQVDLTKHFADEAEHARLWTACLDSLGVKPLKLLRAYQDRYLDAAGLPANLVEILALTHVFEHRVVSQYRRHQRATGVHPVVARTLRTILRDEGWHLHWVGAALDELAVSHGRAAVDATLARYREADRAVYESTLDEFEARLDLAGLPKHGEPP